MKLQPFRIEHYYGKYEFTAKYMLSSSDAESRSLAELLAFEPDARARFEEMRLGYTEVPGSLEMRRAAASLYKNFSGDEVRIFSSAEECIFVAYHALVGSGDHVIIESPHYESASELARSAGAEVSVWQRHFEDGWAHDLQALERLIQSNTKLIYICTPANPMGILMKPDVFQAVMNLAQERNIIVLCDEVYRELEHDPSQRLPAACEIYENAISIGSMSKSYGLPGLRLGWLASRNEHLLIECMNYKMYTTICSSAPSEFLSALALRHREVLVQRNLEIVQHNLPLLKSFFERHAKLFQVIQPNGSPTCFPRLNVPDVLEFCETVVEKTSVLLLPGMVYNEPYHVRMGYGRANMPQALELLEQYLQHEHLA